jgi:hypothetical protein
MRTATIVSRVLSDCKDYMHATRWQRLVDLSNAAVNGQALALTQLALGSASPTTVRHRVKAVDRFLGNPAFAAEHLDIYRTLAAHWLRGVSPLLIVVDWSSLSADMAWHWLRASVVVEGRSITLYEEVHPRKHLAAYAVHRRFLERLACVLPAQTSAPIILTDAGFRGTWFALVKGQGWDWVGRIRNREFVCRVEVGQAAAANKKSLRWFPAKALYADACATGYLTARATSQTVAASCASSVCHRPESGVTPVARRTAIADRRRSRRRPVSPGCSHVRRDWRTSQRKRLCVSTRNA